MATAEKYAEWLVANQAKKGTPEFETVAQAYKIARVRSLGREGVTQPPPMPFKPSGETALSAGEEFLANPYGRALVGSAKPIIGTGQLALNIVGQGEDINRSMQDLAQSTAKAREYVGSSGVDLADLAGQSATFGLAATKIPNAATTMGRIWQGSMMGAGAGGAEPVYNPENYWGAKTSQIGGGAITGGAVPAGWEAGKLLGRTVRNMVQPTMGTWGANRATGRLANLVAGDKADDIIRQLEKPEQFVSGSAPTAGQAAVPAGSAEFSALQKVAASRDPSRYHAIERAQNEARAQALRSIGKTPTDITAAKTARAAATDPMREAAFESTRAVGVSSEKLLRQIRAIESQPGDRATDVVRKGLSAIKEKIAAFSEDGFINAKDLYAIRKELGKTIADAQGTSVKWDKARAASLERDVQLWIDDAIEAAGGTGWKDYMRTYAQMSKPIEQMKAGQTLQTQLDPALGTRQRSTRYAEALRKMGQEGELDVMRPEQMEVLRSVKHDLARDLERRNLAQAGMPATLERIGAAVPKAAPTGFFDPRISVTRSWYNALTGQATNKILDTLARNMDKPQVMAKIMREATPFERQALVDALMRYQATVPVQMGSQ